MRNGRRGALTLGLAAALIALPASSSSTNDDGGGASGADTEVEVFSWWAGPGEKEGLEAMIADFTKKNPAIKFNNAAVAGGAGTNAQTVLATRLQAKNPPDHRAVQPLSNLDAKLRVSMRAQLSLLHQRLGTTTVYVTHDQVEAMTLGQPVAVLRDGVLQQCDT